MQDLLQFWDSLWSERMKNLARNVSCYAGVLNSVSMYCTVSFIFLKFVLIGNDITTFDIRYLKKSSFTFSPQHIENIAAEHHSNRTFQFKVNHKPIGC